MSSWSTALSNAQHEMLHRVAGCPTGFCDTLANRTLVSLQKKGLVEPTNIVPDFGYNPRSHRAGGGQLQADWVLTDAGREAIADEEKRKREAVEWSKRFNKTLDRNREAARKRNAGSFGMGTF